MTVEGTEMTLDIAGLGIVFHSPVFAEHIADGADYFGSNYTTEEQVQAHIQKGTLVGFCTGSPGTFVLRFHDGYPHESALHESEFKLRLGLHCKGGVVCFRDLFELIEWHVECPPDRIFHLDDGFYHVTLRSNSPASGIIGDNQVIDFYLQRLAEFPKLAKQGIPTLCM
jgi:hypothetical protein